MTSSTDHSSDFGMSRISIDGSGDSGAKQTKSDVGPLKYMPPESIMDRIYSTKSDVWWIFYEFSLSFLN